ncbi:circadian clock KaiB family protein [Sulfitobacter sp. S190]|uniref:circadian clock KaiB family protein n=1 Tax=Sulfitobacter sp. S190 TaxID=2867022 RepID=UPI0021A89864|nr:circadian clock KaiB family protein [Sulfitobacter sp. S190]UWR21269.1 hypothetical protein K3756_11140 [Sulfitobacter sp. S190]
MDDPTKEQLSILIFVAGEGASADIQIRTLSQLLTHHNHPAEALEVIDLNETPEAAIEFDILAIPTVLRLSPKPPVRIIGELFDEERVWSVLSA